jgi:hypothetical protein
MRVDQIAMLPVFPNMFVQKVRTQLNCYGRKVLTAGLALSTFAIFVFLIARDWDTLQQFEWSLKPSLLILALCAHAVSLGGTFIAWKLIMRYLGSPVRIEMDFLFYFLSLAARKIPSAIWYIGARTFLYTQEGISAYFVLSAIAIEFIIAVLTGGWVFVAFRNHYLFMENYVWVGHGLVMLTLLLTILFLIQPQSIIKWIQRRAEQGHDSPTSFLSRRNLIICSVPYLVAWAIGGTSFYLTIWALIPNPGIDWFNVVGIATLSTLIVLIGTILPMGIGLKELAAGVLLSPWLPVTVGLSVSVIYRLLQTFDEALWIGLAYSLYLFNPIRHKSRENLPPDNPNGVL